MIIRKVFFAFFIILSLTACNRETHSEQLPTLDATRLNETAISLVTADFAETETRIPTQTATPTETATPIPTLERTRPLITTPTTELACNRAAAGSPIDVTIPDDTKITPGTSFSKTWRLANVGSCTWTRQYAVTFFSGNSLGAQQTHYLQQPVPPGSVVDITVDMVAPQTVGRYQSNWMISDPGGSLFGIGPHGDAPFWVRIDVVSTVTDTPQPTLTVTPTPVIYVTGEAYLGDDDQLDLDTAALNPVEDLKADLVYQIGADPNHRLIPLNGMTWVVFGETQPSYADCAGKSLSDDTLSFNDVPEGIYLCYRTSEELPGRLLIKGLEAGKLSLSFVTWSMP